MTPSLSETLAPPSTTAYGRLTSVGELLQHADLGGDQAARGVREPGRQVVDRGVLAVHGAEAVADVQVGQRGQLVGEGAALGVVLAGLPGVEAQVLQQGDLAVGEAGDGGAGALARPCRRRRRRPCRGVHRAASRPGRARTAGRARPWGGRGARRRSPWRRASASLVMVGTAARIRPSSVMVVAVERDVQVGADEHPLARHALGDEFVDRLHASGLLGLQTTECGSRHAGQGPAGRVVAPGEPCHGAARAGAAPAGSGQSWPPTKIVRSTRRLE